MGLSSIIAMFIFCYLGYFFLAEVNNDELTSASDKDFAMPDWLENSFFFLILLFQLVFVYIWLSQIYKELKQTVWKYSIKWHRKLFCWGKMKKKTDDELEEIAEWEEDAEAMAESVQYFLPLLWESYNLGKLSQEEEELFIRYLRVLRAQNRIWDAEDNNEKPKARDLRVLKEQSEEIEKIEKPPHLLRLEKIEKKEKFMEQLLQLEAKKERLGEDPDAKDEISKEQEKLKVEIDALNAEIQGNRSSNIIDLSAENRDISAKKDELGKEDIDNEDDDSEKEEDEYWKKMFGQGEIDPLEQNYQNDFLSEVPEFIQVMNVSDSEKQKPKKKAKKGKKRVKRRVKKNGSKVKKIIESRDEEESEEDLNGNEQR